MKKHTALKIELTACRIGVRVCMVLAVLSVMMMDWMAVVASMFTMLIAEAARQLVTKQLDETE